MSATDPAKAVAARIEELEAAARALEQRSGALSMWRGLTFLLVIGGIGVRLARPLPDAAWALVGVAAIAFVGLVVAHARLVTQTAEIDRRIGLVKRSLLRIAGDIAELPARGERFITPGHAYLGDLDIFGRASLFQLVSTAETGLGERTLATWLSLPASAAEVAARQEAVRELAALAAFREELAMDAGAARTGGREAEPLLDWAEGRALGRGAAVPPPPLSRRLARVGQALVVVTVGLLLAGQLLGPAELGRLSHLWLAPLLLQVGILLALRPAMEPVLSVAASPEAPFGRYLALIRRIEGQPFSSPRLQALRATLLGEKGEKGEKGESASHAIESLERIVSFAELRSSGLIHILANLVLLWDVFCALALSRFRDRFGGRVRGWLAALAEVEALASLAAFAHEHPGFAFPDVTEGELCFEAEGLGHPLIPAARRVPNDVSLGGAGVALLITGSNMSGKSTLLRSFGVNAVLALAGAPVCATRLRMRACQVRSSMRIKDSLEEGVSHFYAELGRLKAVVDAVNSGEKVLFLLDEVLHGTNSRERQIGARAVVLHLLRQGAVGAVSSHDLGLSELEAASAGKVTNMHFQELVLGGKMTFDYKLKPGVVHTANALRLMKLIGIAVELPEVD